MSLINEALKKAQKQRTGDSTPLPAIGGESAERIARRSRPSGANKLLLGLGIGGGALVAVIVGGVFLLQKKTPAPPPVAVSPTPPAVKPAEPPASSSPVASTPAPTPAPVTLAVPTVSTPAAVTPPQTEAPAPLVVAETPKPAATAAPVPATPVVAIAPVAAPTPPATEPAKPATLVPGKLEPRAINFIESLRIAGIRASASDSKVLMNDRVYRVGSIVEADMGLKLTGITTHSLTFEDDHGASYTRTF